jgi:hypothetical protein
MSTHEEQPTLCDECLDLVSREVEENPTWTWTMRYCAHTGALAIVDAKEGQIRRWTVKGPLTTTEAWQAIHDGVATSRAKVAQAEAERAMRGTH